MTIDELNVSKSGHKVIIVEYPPPHGTYISTVVVGVLVSTSM